MARLTERQLRESLHGPSRRGARLRAGLDRAERIGSGPDPGRALRLPDRRASLSLWGARGDGGDLGSGAAAGPGRVRARRDEPGPGPRAAARELLRRPDPRRGGFPGRAGLLPREAPPAQTACSSGPAVVSGLAVSVAPGGDGTGRTSSSSRASRSIRAGRRSKSAKERRPRSPTASGTLFVQLFFAESPAAPVPALLPGSEERYSRVEENFSIDLSPAALPAGVSIARFDRRPRPMARSTRGSSRGGQACHPERARRAARDLLDRAA
jgi:hypothetical protein